MAWEKPRAGIVAQLGMPEANVAWGEAAGNLFFFASGATAEMAFLRSQAAKSAQCSDHCLGHLMAEDDLLPPWRAGRGCWPCSGPRGDSSSGSLLPRVWLLLRPLLRGWMRRNPPAFVNVLSSLFHSPVLLLLTLLLCRCFVGEFSASVRF